MTQEPQFSMRKSSAVNTFSGEIYSDFYRRFAAEIENPIYKNVVELGSGGGFLKELLPNVITSDVQKIPAVDLCFSAENMPFRSSSVDAFLMIDVLHHIPNPRYFFREADRCLTVGGKIIMIEPANTMWGRFIYRNFHHEPFEPAADWILRSTGPLSGANGAMAWIIFDRDRAVFESEFPGLRVVTKTVHTPFRYLMSGGLSHRQLLPTFSYGLVCAAEWLLSPMMSLLGMFITIELQKIR